MLKAIYKCIKIPLGIFCSWKGSSNFMWKASLKAIAIKTAEVKRDLFLCIGFISNMQVILYFHKFMSWTTAFLSRTRFREILLSSTGEVLNDVYLLYVL